jgi:excinuclease ABC subunit C
LTSVRKVIERQQMVAAREEDIDAVALVEDSLEASVQVFFVRKGRVVGRKGLVVDKVEDLSTAALVGRILEQLYGGAPAEDVPREVLVPVAPDDIALYEEFLTAARGGRVRVRVPQRGAKRALLGTVTHNAEEAFARHKLRRASDHNARARALTALQDALQLPEAPLRVECFDISNLQSAEIVGSMVVMEDGLAKRSDYRRFRVRRQEGQDDLSAMEEVLTRRFRKYLAERDEGARRGKRFAYPPNLLLVDGGKGQLGVAVRVLEELGLEEISVAALAKRFEEVYVPDRPDPVRIPRDSEALYLLQQVRDEAHRFAITYHRQLRRKGMTRSVLDEVPGLGPTRRARLLRELGSVKKLRELSEDDLVALRWLPDRVGRALYQHLHGGSVPSWKPEATDA